MSNNSTPAQVCSPCYAHGHLPTAK